METEELIELAKNGDPNAIATVVENSVSQVRSYVGRYADSMRQSAEDLLQEVAIEIFTKWIEAFEPGRCQWSTYLYNKVYFYARDFSRRRVNSPTCHFQRRNGARVNSHSLAKELCRDGNKPKTLGELIPAPNEVEPRDNSLDVRHLIATTPKARDRQLLQRIFLEGMTQAAFAETIGVLPSRACQLHRSVLRSLKQRIANRESAQAIGHQTSFGYAVRIAGYFQFSVRKQLQRPGQFHSLAQWREIASGQPEGQA